MGGTATAARRSSLKPLHWSKVTRALQGSLWEELQRHGDPQMYFNSYDFLYLYFLELAVHFYFLTLLTWIHLPVDTCCFLLLPFVITNVGFLCSSAPEFDVSEIESLFSAAVPNPAESGGKAGGRRKSVGSKTDKVHLVISYNLNIFALWFVTKRTHVCHFFCWQHSC